MTDLVEKAIEFIKSTRIMKTSLCGMSDSFVSVTGNNPHALHTQRARAHRRGNGQREPHCKRLVPVRRDGRAWVERGQCQLNLSTQP